LEEKARVADAAGEVGGVGVTVGDHGREYAGVVGQVVGGIALGAGGSCRVQPALEDAVGEADAVDAISGKERTYVAGGAEVGGGVIGGALGGLVRPWDTSVVRGGIPVAGGADGAAEGVGPDDGVTLVIRIAVGDGGERHAQGLGLSSEAESSPLTGSVDLNSIGIAGSAGNGAEVGARGGRGVLEDGAVQG